MEIYEYKVVYTDKNGKRHKTMSYKATEIRGVIEHLDSYGYKINGVLEIKERFIDIGTLILNSMG